MNISDKKTTIPLQDLTLQDPMNYLSFEVAIHVFSLLSLKELANSSLVSRNWNHLTDNMPMWKNAAKILEILNDDIINQQNNNTFNFRACVGEKIKALKFFVNEAQPLFENNVKADMAFNELLNAIASEYSILPKPHRNALRKGIEGVLNEQKDLSNKIQQGFNASLSLRRVGLSTWDSLYRFAILIKQRYEDDSGWEALALEKVRENDKESAIKILDRNVDNYFNKVSVNERIIDDYLENGQIIEAIEFYKKHCTGMKNNRGIYSSKNIFMRSIELKQLDVAEKLLDEIGFLDTNFLDAIDIGFLLDALLSDKKIDDVRRCMQKYEDRINPEADEASTWIDRFVKVGYNEKAWRLALKWKDLKSDLMKCFHKTLMDNYQFEDAKKAGAMI